MADVRSFAGSISIRNLALDTVGIDGRHTADSNFYNKLALGAGTSGVV